MLIIHRNIRLYSFRLKVLGDDVIIGL